MVCWLLGRCFCYESLLFNQMIKLGTQKAHVRRSGTSNPEISFASVDIFSGDIRTCYEEDLWTDRIQSHTNAALVEENSSFREPMDDKHHELIEYN